MFKEQKVVLHPNILDLGNIRITIVNSVTISERQYVASYVDPFLCCLYSFRSNLYQPIF